MSAAQSPRTLVTLPHDVLHEILSYVLLDTTDKRRVSILRVSRALHLAAGVHLYRTVYAKSLTSWRLLFEDSPASLLTEEGRRDLGRHVRELRLGAREVDFREGRYIPFKIGTVLLPSLSTLIIEPPLIEAHRPALLRPFFAQFTPQTLRFTPPASLSNEPFLQLFSSTTLTNRLGLPYRAWPSLRTVYFDGVLHTSLNPHSGGTRSTIIALSQWEVGTVVFSPRGGWVAEEEGPLGMRVWHVLFGVVMGELRAGEGAYEGWGRVEMRVGAGLEARMREAYEENRRWGRTMADEERRLMGLIVFVGRDGVERRLAEP